MQHAVEGPASPDEFELGDSRVPGGRDPLDFTYRQRRDPQDDTRLIVECLARVKEELPTEWGLLVGDILTNLRAALDHALFGHITARHPSREVSAEYPVPPPCREVEGGEPAQGSTRSGSCRRLPTASAQRNPSIARSARIIRSGCSTSW